MITLCARDNQGLSAIEHRTAPPLAYNLHPAFLPWARGLNSLFWTLWERAPAGATLHIMDAGFDTGPIVAQLPVAYDESDSRGDLQKRISDAEAALLSKHWPAIAAGEILDATPQPEGGFYRSRRDLAALVRRIGRDPERSKLSAAELVRLVQCLGHLDVNIAGRKYGIYITPLD